MIDRLNNYRYLKERWLSIVEEISNLKYARDNYQPPTLSSVVGGISSGNVSSPTENAAVNSLYFYEEVDRKIKEKEKEKADIEREIAELDEYIDGIEDATIKKIVEFHYRKGYGWRRTAEVAYYAPNSWYYVKRMVTDYINSHTF